MVFCVLISRHMREIGVTRRKRHMKWLVSQSACGRPLDSYCEWQDPISSSAYLFCRKVQKGWTYRLSSILSFFFYGRRDGHGFWSGKIFRTSGRRFEMRDMFWRFRGASSYPVWPCVLCSMYCPVDSRERLLSFDMRTDFCWRPEEDTASEQPYR